MKTESRTEIFVDTEKVFAKKLIQVTTRWDFDKVLRAAGVPDDVKITGYRPSDNDRDDVEHEINRKYGVYIEKVHYETPEGVRVEQKSTPRKVTRTETITIHDTEWVPCESAITTTSESNSSEAGIVTMTPGLEVSTSSPPGTS